MTKWNYNGDMGLEYGGFYWREDGADDYVLAVRVTPCSDAGGPDNLFHIESGSIYIGTDPDRARCAVCLAVERYLLAGIQTEAVAPCQLDRCTAASSPASRAAACACWLGPPGSL